MKKFNSIICLLLVVLILMNSSISFALSGISEVTDTKSGNSKNMLYTYGEKGEEIKVIFNDSGNISVTEVFIEGNFDSKTIIDYNNNKITEYRKINNDKISLNNVNRLNYNNVNEYDLKDIIKDIEEYHSLRAYYPKPDSLREWKLLDSWGKNPQLNDTKPVDLYVKNYDEEPDSNIFAGKQLVFKPEMSTSTIISLIWTVVKLISGGATFETAKIVILKAIGISSVTSAIDGIKYVDVKYSTQKILYRPVISNKIIFNDAYITKLWLISYRKGSSKRYYELANPAYKSFRGQKPWEIARNAQTAELSMR
ncbi:hypothetical protein ACWOAQ_07895 [Helcococcus kunzii]|uniref:hypothetical protein n=1 Tax=Helcococcus kunzii TaxID=40091 RepID=UPI001BB0937E|nr:hypothetical protein [Helcococcus kunzii]MCT1988624.1 hypothetical protein [Helcococcus kunzii]